jgi:hypothetical protein
VIDDLTFVFVENVLEVFDTALLEARPVAKAARKA